MGGGAEGDFEALKIEVGLLLGRPEVAARDGGKKVVGYGSLLGFGHQPKAAAKQIAGHLAFDKRKGIVVS